MTILQQLKQGYADAEALRRVAPEPPRTGETAWIAEDMAAWALRPSARAGALTAFGHSFDGTELLIIGIGLVVLLAGKR